jgi:hypothetical protein
MAVSMLKMPGKTTAALHLTSANSPSVEGEADRLSVPELEKRSLLCELIPD